MSSSSEIFGGTSYRSYDDEVDDVLSHLESESLYPDVLTHYILEHVERFEKRLVLSVGQQFKVGELKLHLMLIRTFLWCSEERNIDFMEHIEKYLNVEDVLERIKAVCLIACQRSIGEELVNLYTWIRDKVTPKIVKVLFIVSESSNSLPWIKEDLPVEYIDSLLEILQDLEDLFCYNINLKENIEALVVKLGTLKGIQSLVVKQIKYDNKERERLLRDIQVALDTAAYISSSFLVFLIDKQVMHRMDIQISELLLDPVLHTCVLKEMVTEIVDTILDKIEKKRQQTNLAMTWRDEIDNVLEELQFLRYFIIDPLEEHPEPVKLNDLLIFIRFTLFELQSSMLDSQMSVGTNHWPIVQLTIFFKQLGLIKSRIREVCFKVPKLTPSSFPKTDELGAFDFFLQNLAELMYQADSIPVLKKHQIESLQGELVFLRSFLSKICQLRDENQKLKCLWTQIIELAFKVEFVIDALVVKNRVWHCCLWFCDVAEEVKHITADLLDNNYLVLSNGTKNFHYVSLHETIPIVDDEIVGFIDEERTIMEQLLNSSPKLEFLSIIGMPGLGKTTLAKKVYNNPLITESFYVRGWATVTRVYKKKNLLIEILKHFHVPQDNLFGMSEEELAEKLYKVLKGQKFLIIMDDIWDIGAWDGLRRCFPDDRNHSRIVFTSRFQNLIVGPNSKSHHLRLFSDEECWELLKKKVCWTESFPQEISEVGKNVARQCKGLPLAVVVVAGLLPRMEQDHYGEVVNHWRDVGNCLSSYVVDDILELSYLTLPDYLKPCLLHLGAIRDNAKIPVPEVVRLWVAEGFVQHSDPMRAEKIATSYLMDLIHRSLILVAEMSSLGGIKACYIHDLVRDFCYAKAEEEMFLHSVDYPYPAKYEHHRMRIYDQLGNISESWCVRSLQFCIPPDVLTLSIIHCFKLLRVLKICWGFHEVDLPAEIEFLVHLRYLQGPFSSIPSSVANLVNLETLHALWTVSILPRTIWSMVKLRHLINVECNFDETCSSCFSNLENLQYLSEPLLSYGDHAEKAMRRFPNLRKLSCIFLDSWDSSSNCLKFPVLDFLSELESLKVSYRGEYPLLSTPYQLRFPLHIKKLTLSWFGFPWYKISTIGKLPRLEVLKLLNYSFVGTEWNADCGEFLKLKYLKLEDLDLDLWNASCDHFPRLERLVIKHCYRLKEVPSSLGDLSTLKMIELFQPKPILRESVRRIQEEQKDMGNHELVILIKQKL